MTRPSLRSPMPRSRIGWGALLLICCGAFVLLGLTVSTVRNEVIRTERAILALKKEKLELEIEFQSRANQRRLANWNRLEYGYVAPRAEQFIEGRTQLAELGQSAQPGGPSPIRLARLEQGAGEGLPARPMVSPVSGAPVTLAAVREETSAADAFSEAFGAVLVEASPIRQARAETGERARVAEQEQ